MQIHRKQLLQASQAAERKSEEKQKKKWSATEMASGDRQLNCHPCSQVKEISSDINMTGSRTACGACVWVSVFFPFSFAENISAFLFSFLMSLANEIQIQSS